MAITGQRLLTELGQKAWSGFNLDDMKWSSDDSLTAKTELNSALRYLFALEDFPFKNGTKTIKTVSNKSAYTIQYGNITGIYDNLGNELIFAPDNSFDKSLMGKPTNYWINYKSQYEQLRLYPIPDTTYQIDIKYSNLMPVIDSDGITKYEFENADDMLNIPDNIAFYFMDCLILKTMEQNNKDIQDENYQPIINEFNERWKVFKKMSNPVKTDVRIVCL